MSDPKPRKRCFAIMPITTPKDVLNRYGDDEDHFLHIAEFLFRPAAEAAGYEFFPPSIVNSKVIQAEIIRNLEQADLVLCDMSCWNANVFFELGIRVALDRPVAMLRDDFTTDIPFDNSPVSAHQYNSSTQPWIINEEIPKLQAALEAVGSEDKNELWRYFGITQRAREADTGSPEDARYQLILSSIDQLTKKVDEFGWYGLVADGLREPRHSQHIAETLIRTPENPSSAANLLLEHALEYYGQGSGLDITDLKVSSRRGATISVTPTPTYDQVVTIADIVKAHRPDVGRVRIGADDGEVFDVAIRKNEAPVVVDNIPPDTKQDPPT